MQTTQLSTRKSRRGYSLLEMLVAMAMLTILIVALLSVFDSSARLARTQTELAGVQQSLRVAHHEVARVLRMAGAGGLPLSWNQVPVAAGGIPVTSAEPEVDYDTFGAFPKGFGISLDNNTDDIVIPADITPTTSASSDSDLTIKHYVLPGSDMLSVRGVFSAPVYYVTPPVDVEQDLINSDGDLSGMIRLPNRVNDVVSRPLGPFLQRIQDAIDDSEEVALIARDLTNPDAYVVMRLNPTTTYLTPQSCSCQLSAAGVCTNSFDHGVTYTDFREGKCVTIGVEIPTSGDKITYGEAFGNLTLGTNLLANAGSQSINLPAGAARTTVAIPKQLGSLGILEEYRFYVRAEYQIPGDATSGLSPILTRAEFVPGTDELVDRVDLVENIVDMQVAFAVDTDKDMNADGHGLIFDNGSGEDEILFNSVDDDPENSDPALLQNKFPDLPKWYNPELEYHYLRITTVAQTTKPDLNHRAAPLGVIEDSNRGGILSINGTNFNLNSKLNYRRRYLTTIVDMRNLK